MMDTSLKYSIKITSTCNILNITNLFKTKCVYKELNATEVIMCLKNFQIRHCVHDDNSITKHLPN